MGTLRTKIIVLAVLPLLAALGLIGALLSVELNRLEQDQARLQEEAFLAAKREELRNALQLGLSSIDPLYRAGRNDEAAQREARNILRGINFGADGYFFVYDLEGRNLVHPRLPHLEGQPLIDLQDSQGVYVIRELLARAREGGGFQRYEWPKPSTGQPAPKLGYAVQLERWGWMVGTGLYLDDVERATAGLRSNLVQTGRETLLALAAVGVVATLAVAGAGLVLNVSEQRLADRRIRQLADRVVLSQEEERARVSRELHDHVCQLLVSQKYRFEIAAHQLDAGAPEAHDSLRQAVAGLADAIGVVRRISHDLRPALLDDLGLDAALKRLADDFSRRSGIEVDLALPGTAALPQAQAVALFRIAQEALANVERHAQARRVRLALEAGPGGARLEVSDDGRGFEAGAGSGAGIGLSNIRQRAESLGGRLELRSVPGGTWLRVQLPAADARVALA
jgi:two-component system, NarL family, sensor kinase